MMVSPYRLTIVAAIVALCLLGGVAFLLLVAGPNGSPERAAPLLSFLAPTIVAMLALLRVEQVGAQTVENHAENTQRLIQLSSKVDGIGTVAEQSANASLAAAQAGQAAAQAVRAASAVEGQASGTDKST